MASYLSKINDRRETILSRVKMFNNAEGLCPINDIQSLFSESMILYAGMMKNIDNFKSLRKELLDYEEHKHGDDNDDEAHDVFSEDDNMDVDKHLNDQEDEDTSG